MICPNCSHNLTPLTITTVARGRLEVDHCYFCGGVWFDHYEINRFPMKEALQLSRVATAVDLNLVKGNNECPRDGSLLTQARNESIPPDISVLVCPKCGGSFVNKSDLITLKKAQKLKLEYFKAWKIPIPSLSSFLIPSFLLIITSLAVVLTGSYYTKQREEIRIKASELIGVPTVITSQPNLVVISFTTTVPALTSIAYYEEGAKEPHTIPVSVNPETKHIVILKNLNSGKNYKFKIYLEEASGKIISSSFYTFRTN